MYLVFAALPFPAFLLITLLCRDTADDEVQFRKDVLSFLGFITAFLYLIVLTLLPS